LDVYFPAFKFFFNIFLDSDTTWYDLVEIRLPKKFSVCVFIQKFLRKPNLNEITLTRYTSEEQAVDSSCLKDTKQGASATGAGKVFQILVVCGKKLCL
jgi:hypothetical protein